MTDFPKNDKQVINAWAMFDWANSAYFLVISTAVFPIYYTTITEETVTFFNRELSNNAIYSYAVSFAYLLMAVITPALSGMADYGGKRKSFLKFFTWMGSIACFGLFFFTASGDIWLGIAFFMIATLGAGGGIVFYNSFLPIIATEDMYDKVSARGYAFGYIGSVLLLAFCLVMINKPELFGFLDAGLPTRISFALVGVWWLGFAQITFKRLPKDVVGRTSHLVMKGFSEIRNVTKELLTKGTVMRFLLSFFFYMAGVQTVIYLATIFASVELEMATAELILVVLILQVVAIAGAYFFAQVSKWVGNRNSLLIQIAIWMLICVAAYFVTGKVQFYVLAGFVGLVLGGIQSLSRATYAKLIEAEEKDLTSYFSFYDVLMKVSLVLGAFIFGLAEQLTGDMRNSVLTLVVLFGLAMILMWTVRSKHFAH